MQCGRGKGKGKGKEKGHLPLPPPPSPSVNIIPTPENNRSPDERRMDLEDEIIAIKYLWSELIWNYFLTLSSPTYVSK